MTVDIGKPCARTVALAELAAVKRFSRAAQCGVKLGFPSRHVAENFATLVYLAEDGVPLHAYPCPWCSTDSGVQYHVGHSPKEDAG